MNENHDESTVSRRKKPALQPEVLRLARDGLSSREIAEKVGVSKTTVGKWLRAARHKRAAKKAPDPAAALRKKIARCQLIADQLFQAWRLSQAERQVRLVEQTGPAGKPADKEKKSVRTETQTGNATYLAKVLEAEDRIEVLQQRLAALEGTTPGGPGGRHLSVANLTDDELEMLTPDDLENLSDDQLFAISARLCDKHRPAEPPLLTNESLRNMSHDELTALKFRLAAECRVLGREMPTRPTQGMLPSDGQPRCDADQPVGPAQRLLRAEPPEAQPPATQSTETQPTETESAVPAGAALENPEKVEPPQLTWQQQHAALLRAKAERKRKLKPFTDPHRSPYRFGQ